jgi:hypothetical protein
MDERQALLHSSPARFRARSSINAAPSRSTFSRLSFLVFGDG